MMDVRDYLVALAKSWRLLVLLPIAGLFLAGGVAVLLPAQFASRADLLVSTVVPNNVTVTDLGLANTVVQQRINSYLILAQSPLVLDAAASEASLNISADELAAHISASSPLNTTVISIEGTGTDPKVAADIANAVAEVFIKTVGEVERTESDEPGLLRVTIIREAVAASSPVSPNVTVAAAIGGLGVLAALLVWILLVHAVSPRIRSGEKLRAVTGLPVVGVATLARDESIARWTTPLEGLVAILLADPEHRAYAVIPTQIASGASSVTKEVARRLTALGRTVGIIESVSREERERAKSQFEFVLIDTPALGEDGVLVLAGDVSRVVLLVDSGTTQGALAAGLADLDHAGAKVVGIVLAVGASSDTRFFHTDLNAGS